MAKRSRLETLQRQLYQEYGEYIEAERSMREDLEIPLDDEVAKRVPSAEDQVWLHHLVSRSETLDCTEDELKRGLKIVAKLKRGIERTEQIYFYTDTEPLERVKERINTLTQQDKDRFLTPAYDWIIRAWPTRDHGSMRRAMIHFLKALRCVEARRRANAA